MAKEEQESAAVAEAPNAGGRNSTLGDARKDRIRAEEIFRLEIRRELETAAGPLSVPQRFWGLLNSSFVLWLLSSVVLAGAGALYTAYQNAHSEGLRKALVREHLDTEIGNRLAEALSGLRTDIHDIRHGTSYPEKDMANYTVMYLDNFFVTDATNPRDFSAYPEYRNRSFRSLVVELSSVADAPDLKGLGSAMDAYEEMRDIASFAGATREPAQADSLAAAEKLEKLLNDRVARPQWVFTLPREP
ncbi:MAG TPA: hypothetical protein VGH80_07430 [Xanthomonadaceae bacterium]|jgi:hypothetical protein